MTEMGLAHEGQAMRPRHAAANNASAIMSAIMNAIAPPAARWCCSFYALAAVLASCASGVAVGYAVGRALSDSCLSTLLKNTTQSIRAYGAAEHSLRFKKTIRRRRPRNKILYDETA